MRLEGARPDQFALEPFSPLRIGSNAKTGFFVTFAPSEAGTFTATLLVDSDDPTSPHSVPLDGVAEIINGVDAPARLEGFRVTQLYPNPARAGEALHVVVTLDHPEEGLRLEVIDMLGRVRFRSGSGATDEGRAMLAMTAADMSALPPGAYRVCITATSTKATTEASFQLLR
jgi:hypothetical protein